MHSVKAQLNSNSRLTSLMVALSFDFSHFVKENVLSQPPFVQSTLQDLHGGHSILTFKA